MKWIFYVIAFVYIFDRPVYGVKTKEKVSLLIETDLTEDDDYVESGTRFTMSCKASSKNQKVEWIDPSGKLVKHQPANRVFALEHFAPTSRGRVPTLVLTLSQALVKDSGVWECRSGHIKEATSLCIIDPSEFVDTQHNVTVDSGRSITLSCQATGEPEPRLLWHRNGEIISDDEDSSKYKVMTKFNSQGFEGLLTIMSLEGDDSGVYTCEAIQESPLVDDCTNSEFMNITLQVNYAPKLEDEGDTKTIYAKSNESVYLVCSANGFPPPTYRWFKEISNILVEFPQDQFEVSDDGSEAVLTVKANASTFGQIYRCSATNFYGETEKFYTILKLEKPKKLSEIGFESLYDEIKFNITWDEGKFFPVNRFDIQYFKKGRVVTPREFNWRKGEEMKVEVDDSTKGIILVLSDLEEDEEYWVRIRAVNEIGLSPWSDPILTSTIPKPRNIKEGEEEENEDKGEKTEEAEKEAEETSEQADQGYSDAFYGIFFTGGVIIVAVACMFAVRLV